MGSAINDIKFKLLSQKTLGQIENSFSNCDEYTIGDCLYSVLYDAYQDDKENFKIADVYRLAFKLLEQFMVIKLEHQKAS